MKPTSKTYKKYRSFPFVDIRITRVPKKDEAYVTFVGKIYKNKYSRLTFSFTASQFTDHQIMLDRDVISIFVKKYIQLGYQGEIK